MKWKAERDLLIAQTMTFVQSVAGKTVRAEGRAQSIPLDRPAEAERPAEIAAIIRAPVARSSELREEIRGRVAAFRAHQELFNRDRDEYCNSVLAKVRASAEHPSPAPGNQPAKH
jgi:hypothetical protein